MTIKKILLCTATLVALVVVALTVHAMYIYSKLTDNPQVPFRNIMTDNCFIYVHVANDDSVATVVISGADAHSLLVRKNAIFAPISMIFLYDVMKYNLNIEVREHQFKALGRYMASDKLAKEYVGRDFFSDTTLIVGGRIRDGLSLLQRNTLMYVLLQNGNNCCIADETGTIVVDR